MNNIPLIGVLAARMTSDLDVLDKVATTYTEAIAHAGGLPIILPNIPDRIEEYWALMDGLLLIGGTQDIDPFFYGQENTASHDVDRAKDQLEIGLLRIALAKGIPVLGICRGMQIANVAFGGTLMQNIENPIERHLDYPRQNQAVHLVDIHDSKILPSGTYGVNSIHHQAIDRLGEGFVATAHSLGGIVESIEHRTFPILAVQWHPECLGTDPLSIAIFSWLIERSTQGR